MNKLLRLIPLLLLVLSQRAAADMPVSLAAEERIGWLHLTPFRLDSGGRQLTDADSGTVLHRLRISPSLTMGPVTLNTGLDLLRFNYLFGVDTDLGAAAGGAVLQRADGLDLAEVRELSLTWSAPVGRLTLGLTGSQWGLGLLANSGDRSASEFSVPWYGDRVIRLGLVSPLLGLFWDHTAAKKIFVAAAFDVVFVDENADLIQRGDVALQGVFALFYRPCERVFAGVYVALRDQEDAAGSGFSVLALDLYGHYRPSLLGGDLELDLAGEVAYLHGNSDRLLGESAPDGVKVRAVAAVGRAGLRVPGWALRLGVELGAASGDSDPYDDTSSQFRMDPDMQPSLILFGRYLAAVTARGAERAGDRALVGRAPAGAASLPSQGAVQNTFYVRPVISYRPGYLLDGAMGFAVGYLYARALTDLYDPYNTFRAGGALTTAMGRPAGDVRTLGHELNVAISYRGDLAPDLAGELKLLYGRLWPGAVFANRAGELPDPVELIQLRATVRY